MVDILEFVVDIALKWSIFHQNLLEGDRFVLFFIFNALTSPAIYHTTILRDFLMRYRLFKCNTSHKFKNIDHLSKMVDNMDPLAALTIIKINRNKTVLN